MLNFIPRDAYEHICVNNVKNIEQFPNIEKYLVSLPVKYKLDLKYIITNLNLGTSMYFNLLLFKMIYMYRYFLLI